MREGHVAFHHFDLYAQAPSKIERGQAQDVGDVREMLRRELVNRKGLREYVEAIEPHMYRYPAIDPGAFRQSLDHALEG
jgi:hypothetical protein